MIARVQKPRQYVQQGPPCTCARALEMSWPHTAQEFHVSKCCVLCKIYYVQLELARMLHERLVRDGRILGEEDEDARGEGGGVTFKARKEPLGHGYKEVLFPLGRDGAPTMRSDALHIWPRGHHVLMALANLDGSFTGTVYLPEEGKDSFDECAQAGELGSKDFFSTHYPDATPLLDDEMLDVLLPAERGGANARRGSPVVETRAAVPPAGRVQARSHGLDLVRRFIDK